MYDSQYTVGYKGQLGSVQVLSDERLILDSPAPKNCLQCQQTSAQNTTIAFQQIIGVQNSGKFLELWYCVKNESDKRRITQDLKKIENIEFDSKEKADNMCNFLRKNCCWWGKESAPNVLLIVNPVSGTSKGVQTMQKQIEPVIRGAGLTYDIHITSKAGEAISFLQNLKTLEQYDVIAVSGGDGSVFEVLQGLLCRPDWKQTSKIPLIQFPSGSGNGLACSCGIWDTASALYALIKGCQQPMDVLSVVQSSKAERYFSFYGVQYGLMTNLDIGTENLRWIGDVRFTLGALREIMRKKRYQARIIYKPYESKLNKENHDSIKNKEINVGLDGLQMHEYKKVENIIKNGGDVVNIPEGWQDLGAQQWQLVFAGLIPWIAKDFEFLPSMKLNSGYSQLVTIKDVTRMQGINVLQDAEQGTHMKLDYVQSVDVSAMLLIPMLEPQQNTWLTVDGEVQDMSPLFMEVHPGMCRVLTAAQPEAQVNGFK